MSNSKSSSTGLGWLFWAFIWGCIGYFIYGDINGALVLAFFSAVTGVTAILGLFPVIGMLGTFLVNDYILSWVLGFVTMSWALTVIFWCSFVVSLILTVVVFIAGLSR